MPAKIGIVPLDACPTRQTITTPGPLPARPAKGKRNEAANTDALSSQERRLRLVTAQRRYTSAQLFYGLFGLALMVVQMEYLWFANTKDFDGACPVDAATLCPACRASLPHAVPAPDGRMMLHALRVLISFSTVILLYYVHAFYAAECEVLKIKNIVPPTATLLSSPLRAQLLVELCVFAVHPFPGLESIDPRWPNLVVASSLGMFPRLALLVRVVQFRTAFNSSNGWFIGALTNVDFTVAFFLKSTLRSHPRRWIVSSFVLLLATTGYALFVVERFLCAFHADACCTPMLLTDALWTLVITMLTVGYGDVVPHTAAGRFFAVIAGLFGLLFTAVTIAVMSAYLVLTRSEHKVNAFIKKDENRRLVQDHAARTIQACVQLCAVQRRYHGVTTERAASAVSRAEYKLYDVLRTYRQAKRFVHSHDVSDPMDKQMTMLEMMEVNVEHIRTKIEDLSDLFHTPADRQHKSRRKLQTAVLTTSAVLALASNAGAAVARSKTPLTDRSVEESPRDEVETSGSGQTTTATLGASSSGTSSSTNSIPRANGVPGQPSVYDISDNGSPSRPKSSTSVGLSSPLEQNSSHRTQPADPPEWATVMESTMQAILQQVAQVSNEMDALRTRVETQMGQLHGRIGDLEKRLGVQDAFREIMRAPSSRRLLMRSPSSNGQFGHVGDDANASASGGSDGRSPANGGGPGTLAAVTRLNRKSFASLRPSVHHFVTSKDLEEFHASGAND